MFIRGWTDKDGNSISYEPLGMFLHPDGESWSSKPYTKEQKKAYKAYQRFLFIFDKVTDHLTRTNRSIPEELELIKLKKSTLPSYARKWLLQQ